MLKDSMLKVLNDQINAEMFSSYLYLSMSNHFRGKSLNGMAAWFKQQAEEERAHAMKFIDYIYDRGGNVKLGQLNAPQTEWASPLAAFKAAYDHEQHITGLIHKLVDQAQNEHDLATVNFLQWFIKEQVEEEASVSEVVAHLEMVGPSVGGLFQLDHHLGKRGEK